MQSLDIMKVFLRKLVNLNMWGGKHTQLANLKKSLPKHLRGEKVVDDSIKSLVQDEFVMLKKSTHEVHVSLNPRKQQDIYEFLKL